MDFMLFKGISSRLGYNKNNIVDGYKNGLR